MKRLMEMLLGLDKGFLSRDGGKAITFNPVWPGHHAWLWNTALALLGLALIVYVYRRDGRSRPARILLGSLRALLVTIVLILLNRPVLVNQHDRTEPSVLAVVVDDTGSMETKDISGTDGPTRLRAAVDLFTRSNQALLAKLEKVHTLRFYRFDQNASPIGPTQPTVSPKQKKPEELATLQQYNAQLAAALNGLKADGQNTQVVNSLTTVMDDLQGQRLAGVVLLTDGRETPRAADEAAVKALTDRHVRIYPVAVGGDKTPPDIALVSVEPLDVAFKDDLVAVKASVVGYGYPAGQEVVVSLKAKDNDTLLTNADGRPARATVKLPADGAPVSAEVVFKPDKVGTLNFRVVAERQPGERDYKNNELPTSLDVVDSKINVLFVDGYPRWEYRYVKNAMIRDTTVNISCLLTSADVGFVQQGDRPVPDSGPDRGKEFPGPINAFPESIEHLMPYDVVVFGDVDPRQFTDRQLQLVADFVNKRGGGFGMVAGPRWSPIAYRGTPLEAVLPVNISHVQQDDPSQTITEGWRPILTPAGEASTLFRFFPDPNRTRQFLKEEIQPLFWYCRGITRKSVAQTFAEHPFDIGLDGQKAPLLVVGRYGIGRTLFSAFDDSWRWRYYTGENVFNTYWVQQLRFLARGKKIGSRGHDLQLDRKSYDLGDSIHVVYRVYNPTFLQQLPPEIPVQLKREDGSVVAEQKLQRQEGQPDLYTATFVADQKGDFIAQVTSAAGQKDVQLSVRAPLQETADVSVNRPLLNRLAAATGAGKVLALADAPPALAAIPSAERTLSDPQSNPLWNGWAPLIIFVLLITLEWVLRKVYGML